MGAADLAISALKSGIVRKAIGERIIASPEEPIGAGNPVGNWISQNIPWLSGAAAWVWNATSSLRGFLMGALKKAISWSASAIAQAFFVAARFLWNFNFRTSNNQLATERQARWRMVSAMLGGALGCSVGQVVCGSAIAGSAAVIAINYPQFAGAVKDMTQEAFDEFLDEFSANFGAAARAAAGALAFDLFSRAFQSARNWTSWLSYKAAGGQGGIESADFKELADQVYGENAEPWTFSNTFEEKVIPAISDMTGISEVFLEEFFEEAGDCCEEIVLVMAQSIDQWRADRRDMKEAVLGVERAVQVEFDRENPVHLGGETLIVVGRDELVRPAITSAIANYRLLENRDVGQIVGRDLPQQQRTQPQTKTLYLNLYWATKKKPPFRPVGVEDKSRWISPHIQIPFVDPAKLRWDKIKRAMGGTMGHTFGPWRAYGWLGGYKVEIFGDSEQAALNRLEELAELSEAEELKSIGASRKRSEGGDRKNNVQYYAEPVRCYPAYGFIVARKLVLDRETGQPTIGGNYSRREERFELWLDQEPDGIDQLFATLKNYHTPLDRLPRL